MILSFLCSDTQKLFEGERVSRFVNIERVAVRKLNMLHVAARLEDLRIPPGNRLELLQGDRQGLHSIRINDQYRLCFRFEEGNAYNAEITDYH